MATVAEILKSKPDQQVHAVAPGTTVYAALRLMSDKGIGAVLIQEGSDIRGIFTERDYARKIELMGRSAADTLVQDVMTRAVLFVQHHDTTETCMQLMSSKHLRHLPVLREGQLIGLLSIRDLVQQIISEQQATISQLENYIHGHTSVANS
jgi:CBS domain-containing protein